MSRKEYLELKLMELLIQQELACEIMFLDYPILTFEDSIIRPN